MIPSIINIVKINDNIKFLQIPVRTVARALTALATMLASAWMVSAASTVRSTSTNVLPIPARTAPFARNM